MPSLSVQRRSLTAGTRRHTSARLGHHATLCGSGEGGGAYVGVLCTFCSTPLSTRNCSKKESLLSKKMEVTEKYLGLMISLLSPQKGWWAPTLRQQNGGSPLKEIKMNTWGELGHLLWPLAPQWNKTSLHPATRDPKFKSWLPGHPAAPSVRGQPPHRGLGPRSQTQTRLHTLQAMWNGKGCGETQGPSLKQQKRTLKNETRIRFQKKLHQTRRERGNQITKERSQKLKVLAAWKNFNERVIRLSWRKPSKVAQEGLESGTVRGRIRHTENSPRGWAVIPRHDTWLRRSFTLKLG